MKFLAFLFFSILLGGCAFAQKETFDIVTYNPPSGWEGKQGNGNISYSKIDGGSWAQITIYEHRNSEGDINTDFGGYTVTDSSGNIYLTGNTFSNSYIATAGTYQVNYGGSSDAFLVKLNSNGVMAVNNADTLINSIKIYPNPTTDFIHIQNPANQKIIKAEVFDSNGRLIKVSKTVDNKIDVKNIANGLYILKVSTEKGSQNLKFIKK